MCLKLLLVSPDLVSGAHLYQELGPGYELRLRYQVSQFWSGDVHISEAQSLQISLDPSSPPQQQRAALPPALDPARLSPEPIEARNKSESALGASSPSWPSLSCGSGSGDVSSTPQILLPSLPTHTSAWGPNMAGSQGVREPGSQALTLWPW